MHRRITASFEFRPPNHIHREEIWRLHIERAGITLTNDIDWPEVALRFELAGGFIKNAVMSALLGAIARDGVDSPIVSRSDLEEGCRHQMRSNLQMRGFKSRVVPTAGIDTLVLPAVLEDELGAIISLEKARGVLFGQWGFGEAMRSQQSTTALFWGFKGTGKSSAAEALGFETGRPLKVLNLGTLCMAAAGASGDKSMNGGPVKEEFKDAAIMNAIVVIEGFESLLLRSDDVGHSGNSAMVVDELMCEIERYQGTVVVMVTTSKELSLYMHHLDPDFVRRFKFILEFKLPSARERAKLWQLLLPSKAPRDDKIDFEKLGHNFELSGAQIGRVVYRACAMACLRTAEERKVTFKDLNRCARAESDKTSSEISRVASQWFA